MTYGARRQTEQPSRLFGSCSSPNWRQYRRSSELRHRLPLCLIILSVFEISPSLVAETNPKLPNHVLCPQFRPHRIPGSIL